MRLSEMLVETPVCEADLVDREPKQGRDGQNQCSYCGVGDAAPWYPASQIMAVRHWTTDSQDVPGGGHWTWYCPTHLQRRNGNWWRTSHLAPARLLPAVVHRCGQRAEFGRQCESHAVEPFDSVWMCERHAATERLERRLRDVLEEDDPVTSGR